MPLDLDQIARRAVEHAAEHPRERHLHVVPPAPPASDLRALTLRELDELPAPTWLLPDLVPAGGFVVLYGPPGSGKSFVALDWTLSIATGIPALGRPSTPGSVLYIAAEGLSGMRHRTGAWRSARGLTDIPLWQLVPEAINLTDHADVQRLANLIAAQPQPPAVIVIDTLARSMPGADENSAKDVGAVIGNLDRLRKTAAVIVVHHGRKSDGEERGSSALRGAADVMHKLTPGGGGIRLTCEKSKDSEPYPPTRLGLRPEGESAVVVDGEACPTRLWDTKDRLILGCVPSPDGTQPPSGRQIAEMSGVSRSHTSRRLAGLVVMGYLTIHKDGTRSGYTITEAGRAALATAK